MSEKNRKEILRKRAVELQKQISHKEEMKSAIEVLVFHLSDESYGIETEYIKEIYPFKDYTVLPGLPSFVFGFINVRRRIISIVDLKVFFELPQTEGVNQTVIILENEEMEFSLLNDGIVGLKKLSLENLQTSLPTLTGIRQDFLKGISEEGIIVLDGHKLLTNKNIIVNESVEV